MAALVLPNGSARESGHAFAGLCGYVVRSLSVGPWVPMRRVFSFMCLRIHVAGCVVLRVLEHCAALDSVRVSLGNWATVPCVPVEWCCEAVWLCCVSGGPPV